jgi:hypothetical protein
MTEERLQNNLRYAKEKTAEAENDNRILQSDNDNIRLMLRSLEEKNRTLLDKLAKVTENKDFSILDLKIVFGANEKAISKTKLIDEINDAINKINKKMLKLNPQSAHVMQKKEFRN